MKKFHNLQSVFVLVMIVFVGIFKTWILKLYAEWVTNIFLLFGLNISEFKHLFSSGLSSWKPYQYGWILYYPMYYFLHVLFVCLLFKNQTKTRNAILIALTSLIAILISLILLGRAFEMKALSDVSWVLFRKLIGLPFILLAIEGGRILYNDIRQRLEEV